MSSRAGRLVSRQQELGVESIRGSVQRRALVRALSAASSGEAPGARRLWGCFSSEVLGV